MQRQRRIFPPGDFTRDVGDLIFGFLIFQADDSGLCTGWEGFRGLFVLG
jgi:hypothetical protein